MHPTVMIIDDDTDDCILFSEAVRQVDPKIKCLQAIGSQEAFSMLNDNAVPKPDFIFLDLNMPGLNGKQFLLRIKQIPELKDIPIVIYTTSKLRADEMQLKELGASVFFSKPSKLADLMDSIHKVINRNWDEIKFKPDPFEESRYGI